MINVIYQPWLNEVRRQFIPQQEQLVELQKQVADGQECRTPLEVGFSEVVRSWRTTPSVQNLQKLSSPRGVTKPSPPCQGAHREIILHSRHLWMLSHNTLSRRTIVNHTCPSSSRTKHARNPYPTRATLRCSRANPSTRHYTNPRCLFYGGITSCSQEACR